MKYLRKFEELSPDVYKNAADKLKAKAGGSSKRAEDLYSHIDNLKAKQLALLPTYDIICNNNIVTARIIKIDTEYHVNGSHVDESLEDIMNIVREEGHKALFEVYIDIYFDNENDDDPTIRQALHIPLFSGGDFGTDLEFDKNNYNVFLFSNRRSANLFIRTIKDYLQNEFPISDIITLSNIDVNNQSSNLKKFYDMLDNIDVHKLYDTDTTSREREYGSLLKK